MKTRSLKFLSGLAGLVRHRLQFFCFAQRREQAFRADPEVYRSFRILRLLGHIHALLQSSDFHARHVHRSVERGGVPRLDRKSTRLNSSHSSISYAVFCLKKKKKTKKNNTIKKKKTKQ